MDGRAVGAPEQLQPNASHGPPHPGTHWITNAARRARITLTPNGSVSFRARGPGNDLYLKNASNFEWKGGKLVTLPNTPDSDIYQPLISLAKQVCSPCHLRSLSPATCHIPLHHTGTITPHHRRCSATIWS